MQTDIQSINSREWLSKLAEHAREGSWDDKNSSGIIVVNPGDSYFKVGANVTAEAFNAENLTLNANGKLVASGYQQIRNDSSDMTFDLSQMPDGNEKALLDRVQFRLGGSLPSGLTLPQIQELEMALDALTAHGSTANLSNFHISLIAASPAAETLAAAEGLTSAELDRVRGLEGADQLRGSKLVTEAIPPLLIFVGMIASLAKMLSKVAGKVVELFEGLFKKEPNDLAQLQLNEIPVYLENWRAARAENDPSMDNKNNPFVATNRFGR